MSLVPAQPDRDRPARRQVHAALAQRARDRIVRRALHRALHRRGLVGREARHEERPARRELLRDGRDLGGRLRLGEHDLGHAHAQGAVRVDRRDVADPLERRVLHVRDRIVDGRVALADAVEEPAQRAFVHAGVSSADRGARGASRSDPARA
jgi:hypothetical protein